MPWDPPGAGKLCCVEERLNQFASALYPDFGWADGNGGVNEYFRVY